MTDPAPSYRPDRRISRPIRRVLVAGAAVVALSLLAVPANAIVVFDPSNYAQNVLTAARMLQSIDHQITSLQNQATMLVNQARNLSRLPVSTLSQMQAQVQRT